MVPDAQSIETSGLASKCHPNIADLIRSIAIASITVCSGGALLLLYFYCSLTDSLLGYPPERQHMSTTRVESPPPLISTCIPLLVEAAF